MKLMQIRPYSLLAISLVFVFLLSFVACKDGDWVFQEPATVTSVQLEVDNANFSGACPHTVKFTGTITTRDAGRVNDIISGDSDYEPQAWGYVDFSSPGSQIATADVPWIRTGTDWFKLSIPSQNLYSKNVPVSVTCQ